MADLASVEDLAARGIDTSDTDAVEAFLAAASAAVRNAAGSTITRQVSTVVMWTEPSRRIELPARPVRGVSVVELDGEPVTDWVLRGSCLWRDCRWQRPGDIPSELAVTFDHGFDVVPADVVDLVCAMVGAALAASADGGYASTTGKTYESIDDYRVGFTVGVDAVASVMEVPPRTAKSLRKRFGIPGVTVLGVVR